MNKQGLKSASRTNLNSLTCNANQACSRVVMLAHPKTIGRQLSAGSLLGQKRQTHARWERSGDVAARHRRFFLLTTNGSSAAWKARHLQIYSMKSQHVRHRYIAGVKRTKSFSILRKSPIPSNFTSEELQWRKLQVIGCDVRSSIINESGLL